MKTQNKRTPAIANNRGIKTKPDLLQHTGISAQRAHLYPVNIFQSGFLKLYLFSLNSPFLDYDNYISSKYCRSCVTRSLRVSVMQQHACPSHLNPATHRGGLQQHERFLCSSPKRAAGGQAVKSYMQAQKGVRCWRTWNYFPFPSTLYQVPQPVFSNVED